MNILITGASGFIGSQIVTDFINSGHHVTCCVRDSRFTRNIFPQANIIKCDFNQDIQADDWLDRLKGIDVVINCAGILYHPNKKVTWAIHYQAPKPLFDACIKANINRIIQVSALGIENSKTEYSKSKKAADEYLQSLNIDHVILRPSLIYGKGSYGGTSFFRGLAGLPFMMVMPGRGQQTFQPVHIKELSKTVMHFALVTEKQRLLVNVVSRQKISLGDILLQTRSWLGFSSVKSFYVPFFLIRVVCFLGSLIPFSTVNSTSYMMLMQNNITSLEETNRFQQISGLKLLNFTDGLYSEPSSVQDRWHSRLYFIKPLLRLSIAFIWLFTAICVLFLYPKQQSYQLLAQAGVTEFWQPLFFYGSAALDGLIGLAMLAGYQLRKLCIFQLGVIVAYSIIITWKLPQLWLDPLAPVAKNIPILVAILAFMAMESKR